MHARTSAVVGVMADTGRRGVLDRALDVYECGEEEHADDEEEVDVWSHPGCHRHLIPRETEERESRHPRAPCQGDQQASRTADAECPNPQRGPGEERVCSDKRA